jgi:hypothetical protein
VAVAPMPPASPPAAAAAGAGGGAGPARGPGVEETMMLADAGGDFSAARSNLLRLLRQVRLKESGKPVAAAPAVKPLEG